jgi:predicted CXXCH cytochrome family protein
VPHAKTDRISRPAGRRAGARRRRLGLALLISVALLLAVALAVSAQAETLPPGTAAAASVAAAPVKTHSNADGGGVGAPFSLACSRCHTPHEAASAKLLRAADGAASCATCHDVNAIHSDPATKQAVSALAAPVDCLSCHPHSSGFMPVAGAVSLTITKQVVGYDDLDVSGSVSPGDRVHYRVDYANPATEAVTGAVLKDQPDAVHVAMVEAIAAGGTFDGTAIQWNIGALAAGASGSVTYDLLLKDVASFGGATTTSTTSTTIAPSTTTTLLTTPPAGPIDMLNTAVLTADTREPVSASATVSVVVDGSSSSTSTTSTTSATADSTTTTSPPADSTTTTSPPDTTTTTLPAGSPRVANTAVLTADNQPPVSNSITFAVVVPGLSPGGYKPALATESPAALPAGSTLTLSNLVVGYDDLDGDGNLSSGDRMHYRVEYGNPGQVDVTGAVLRGQLDTAQVISVEAITDGGMPEENAAGNPDAIRWDFGTLAAGASGFVAYDAVLRDAPVMVRDGWFFPVLGSNSYGDSFGAPRYAGGYHPHQGADILCSRGTALVAVVGGIVTRANPLDTGLGGITTWLDGDDGNSYYYAHLSAIQDGITSGVRVTPGQVIGFAGDTGDAKGGVVHLHFEIHPGGGSAVDPYLVLKGVLLVSEVPKTTFDTTTTTMIGDTTTTTVVGDTTTTTTVIGDTTTTTVAVDTTTTTVIGDTTTTTVAVDTTTTSDTSVTTSVTVPPTTDSTTTTTTATVPLTTTTTVPVAAAVVVFVPFGSVVRRFFPVRRRRR